VNIITSSTAEIRNAWSDTSIPQYVYIMWCLIKQWIHLHGFVDISTQGIFDFVLFNYTSYPMGITDFFPGGETAGA
jgi:hypothetical protein